MAGVFDIKKGAFDSSEAAVLHQAYEIALQGLKATHKVDRPLVNSLARSIVKVARAEPDCLRNDGTIDPVKLAQRAILRMLQTSAPALNAKTGNAQPGRPKAVLGRPGIRAAEPPAEPETARPPTPESTAKIMLRLFERTPFAKL